MELYTHQNANNSEQRKDEAIQTIKSGASLIGDILKTTLGPKGSLKVLQGKETSISNDGAFILKNLLIDSASARIIANSSINQDVDEGDGTTSIAVLSALLVTETYKHTVHPINVIRGFSLALKKCLELLNKKKFAPKPEDIKNLVRTTINSKILANSMDNFVDICIRAVEMVDDINLIEIIKLEGDLSESMLVEGLLLNKSIEISRTSPKILVANTSLDYDKVKIHSSKISVGSIIELEEIEKAEKQKMIEKINMITSLDFDIFINRQIIYDYPMQLLRSKGVDVIEHADFEGVERLNKVLGGEIISTFDSLNEQSLGVCSSVSTINIKGNKLVKFEGVKKGAVTIVVFGCSKEIQEEAERSIHDALCVLKRIKDSPFCVYGGGSIEMALSLELAKYALEIKTKDAAGVEIFGSVLQQIPRILSDNCGFDGEETKAALKNDHAYRRATYGVNTENGKTLCMKERGVIEGYEMKKRVLTAACETAQVILKCDGIIKCPPRERHRH
ncbi:T-complex protein 1 subunit beta [Enteropsectra breve]|nr:T-complex protein 1 subunit beta [Enteropsectra breve]